MDKGLHPPLTQTASGDVVSLPMINLLGGEAGL